MNILLFILVACFWGGSFIAIKPLIEIVPSFTAASLRVLVAVAFLSVLLPLMKIPLKMEQKIFGRVMLTGQFAFAIPFALLFWGERLISPGLAGVIIIFFPQLQLSDSNSLVGAFAVLIMAVSYAVSGLLNRELFKRNPDLHPFTNLFYQLCSGAATLTPVALLVDGLPRFSEWKPVSLVFWSSLYLGLGSTSIAFVIFYRLIKLWGAVRASTVTYIIPPAALLFDFLINNHLPQFHEIVGVMVVTIGVVVLNWPPKENAQPISKGL